MAKPLYPNTVEGCLEELEQIKKRVNERKNTFVMVDSDSYYVVDSIATYIMLINRPFHLGNYTLSTLRRFVRECRAAERKIVVILEGGE